MVAWKERTEGMTLSEIETLCRDSIQQYGYIRLPDVVLRSMSPSDAKYLQASFGGRELLHLPDHEVAFNEWLKQADPAVWADLWDAGTEPPYLVSLAYIADFIGEQPGVFAIRDLQSTDNYFFAPEMIVEKESTAFLEAVRDLFLRREPLTPAQLLALQASNGAVDIWHLAYRQNLTLDSLKLAVRQLVDDHILVHVPNAEHLAALFDVK